MATTFMTKATNARDFQTQIDNLNTKLDSVAKNLTYFDFYNIVDVTVNKNNFSAQVNALTPNTSLIINSEPFFLNNVYYIYHFLENNEPKKLDIGSIVLQ